MLGNNNQISLLVAGFGAAALAAFILYGPVTRRKKRKKGTCVGLTNIGNTCFMNAVLQGLAPCQSVHDWLHNVLLKSGNTVPWLVYAIHNVWKVLNNLSTEVAGQDEYSPAEILDALRLHNWRISPDEQDAHELFHVLTETLDEETAKYPALVPLFDVATLLDPDQEYQDDKKARNRIGTKLPVLPKKNPHPFRGLLASKLQCTVCGHKNPVRYDTFDSLSLTIPNAIPTTMSLETLLKQYMTPERVHDVECEGCQRIRHTTTKPKTTFLKTLIIGKLPQCLCIHIPRTQWLPNGMPMKSPVPVQYPEILNMAPFVFSSTKMCREERAKKALAGLFGGNLRDEESLEGQSLQQTRVRQPYPKLVSELKALHYTDKYYSPGINMSSNNQNQESRNYPNIITAGKTSEVVRRERGDEASTVVSAAKKNSLILANLFRIQNQTNSAMNDYKLMSVVEHYGDVFSGHFVTYRRAPRKTGSPSEAWLLTSDSMVRKVSRDEAMHAEAYMLYYERQAKPE